MNPCTCCGKNWPTRPDARTDTGPIHFRCWDEHHSDPTGEWPPGHVCWADDDVPKKSGKYPV